MIVHTANANKQFVVSNPCEVQMRKKLNSVFGLLSIKSFRRAGKCFGKTNKRQETEKAVRIQRKLWKSMRFSIELHILNRFRKWVFKILWLLKYQNVGRV